MLHIIADCPKAAASLTKAHLGEKSSQCVEFGYPKLMLVNAPTRRKDIAKNLEHHSMAGKTNKLRSGCVEGPYTEKAWPVLPL